MYVWILHTCSALGFPVPPVDFILRLHPPSIENTCICTFHYILDVSLYTQDISYRLFVIHPIRDGPLTSPKHLLMGLSPAGPLGLIIVPEPVLCVLLLCSASLGILLCISYTLQQELCSICSCTVNGNPESAIFPLFCIISAVHSMHTGQSILHYYTHQAQSTTVIYHEVIPIAVSCTILLSHYTWPTT